MEDGTSRFRARPNIRLGARCLPGSIRDHLYNSFIPIVSVSHRILILCAAFEPSPRLREKTSPVTRILVVDDEPQIHRFLQPVLRAAGYLVEQADTGRAGLDVLQNEDIAGVLLDLGLPDLDGIQVLERLRQFSDLPVIVISARDREADKIAALDNGANDYLEKPFGIGELLARLRAALRHRGGIAGSVVSESAIFPGLSINFFRRLAHIDGRHLALTPREWALLELLARNAGQVLTHRHILKTIWGPAHTNNIQYLRVYMGQLRQKLGAAGSLISTETGIGYRMAECLQPTPRQTTTH